MAKKSGLRRKNGPFPGKILRGMMLGILAGSLSGCVLLGDLAEKLGLFQSPPPPRSRPGLWDLSLYQGFDLWRMPYYNAIQPIPRTTPHSPDLPLTHIALKQIPDDLSWLRDYDFNCNRSIDSREMTQAWLIRTAEIKTGNLYGPYALLGPVQVSALRVANIKPMRLTGLSLPRHERVMVRAALDQHTDGQALSASMTALVASTTQSLGGDGQELGEATAPTEQRRGPPHGGTPPGQGGTPPGQGGDPPGGGGPPGGDPPGQGGDPPGQGGDPPGGGKPDKPGKPDKGSIYLPLPPTCVDQTLAQNVRK